MMSAVPIEAGSLSSLTALAAEPPLNPLTASYGRREPVVLYLARVPGSRDVFLTPMKPRTKTVTAQDVESCFYYVHFENSQDDDILDALRKKPAVEGLQHPQQRPLPATPEEAPPLPPRLSDQKAQLLTRPGPLGNLDGTNSVVKRKPVARSAQTGLGSNTHALYANDDPLQASLPPLPARPNSEASNKASVPDESIPTAILVRRDPSSGMQWNVARITDPPVYDVSSLSTIPGRSPRQKGSPIYMDIYNRGYHKFVPQDHQMSSANGLLPRRGTPDTIPSLEYPSTSNSPASMSEEIAVFRRRLWMEGSHFLGGRSRNKGSTDLGHTEGLPGLGGEDSLRDPSSLHPPLADSMQSSHQSRLVARGERRAAIKGYTFLSPWQGRCEFATSTIGSALKCQHRLPGYSEPMTVSELRFNLPSRLNHRKSSSHSSVIESSQFLTPRPRDRKALSISYLGDEFDAMDLSLGQELAGGGATGKQAKLGKLIIENEGLQMMDLVVAANMGLWWRAYSRSADPIG